MAGRHTRHDRPPHVIAKRMNADVFLIGTGAELESVGFVADFEDGLRYGQLSVSGIISRGYWEPTKNDPDIVRRAQRLPSPGEPS